MPRYKCYTRWNNANLICLCKVGNPCCDRYKTCDIEKLRLNKYEGMKECFKNNERKR